MSDLNLPILDLSQLDAGAEAAAAFRDALPRRPTMWGSSTSRAPASPRARGAAAPRTAREFFELPEADKLAIENVHSPQFRGYTRVGGERTQARSTGASRSTSAPSALPSTIRMPRTSPA
jgi:isopenicillin N synthase-like dioxygenase